MRCYRHKIVVESERLLFTHDVSSCPQLSYKNSDSHKDIEQSDKCSNYQVNSYTIHRIQNHLTSISSVT